MDLSSSSLYRSDWNPPGIRKDWDRCGLTIADLEAAGADEYDLEPIRFSLAQESAS